MESNSEADKLRRNFAKYLAHSYLNNPTNIADICDNSLDRTGILLGYVREEAYKLRDEIASRDLNQER